MQFLRQLDVIKPVDFPPITLIGAGGIGSFTALSLVKMGVKMLSVVDFDAVEEHNVACQLYGSKHLKESKVVSLRGICEELGDTSIMVMNDLVTPETLLSGDIIISGVDSMKARYDIWEAIKLNKPKYYIDARMGLEVIRMFTLDMSQDTKWYENHLYPDESTEIAPCTARAIIYTGFMVAGLISSQVKKIVKNEDLNPDITFDIKNLILV